MVEKIQYLRPNPAVTYEWMDGEVIAVNLNNGHYFSFTETAAPVFCAFAAGASVAQVRQAIATIANTGDSPDAIDLADWLQRVLQESLFIEASNQKDERAESPPEDDAEKWLSAITTCKTTRLTFQKYTDIEALLALDPVQEISSAGWPERK